MQKNGIYIIIAALIITSGIIFWGLSNRYYIDTSTHLKVDRLTGKLYKISDTGLSELTERGKIENNTAQTPKPTQSPVPTMANPEKKESISYINNLILLKNTRNIYSKFKDYYYSILDRYDNDPLAENFSGWRARYIEEPYNKIFIKYSQMLSPQNIRKVIIEKNIRNANDYINYLIEYYAKIP